MRLTSQDTWDPPSGDAVVWQVPAWHGEREPVTLSVNQVNHVMAAQNAGPVWLAVQVEVPAAESAESVAAAAETVLRRHDALHVVTTVTAEGTLEASRVPAEALELEPAVKGRLDPAGLWSAVDAACDLRRGAPALAVVTIHGEHGNTALLVADHLHVDAISMVVLAAELVQVLGGDASQLHDDPGSFLSSVATDLHHRLHADDPRVQQWTRFVELTGGTAPSFPLKLDVPAGELADQRTVVGELLTTAQTERLHDLARADGASVFSALLATLYEAFVELGAPMQVPVVVPVQTRQADQAGTVGWFTTSVPVVLEPATDGNSQASTTYAAVRRALTTADAPLEQLLASLPTPLSLERSDVFMISYLDYRRVHGWDVIAGLDPWHVSRSTLCDDVQVWITRSEDGVWTRVRLPGTVAIEATVRDLLEVWAERLRKLLSAG